MAARGAPYTRLPMIGAVLVTNNTRHFERVAAPLALANWHEG
jgi:hypothetical protein